MEKNKEVFIIYLTEKGKKIGETLKPLFNSAHLMPWKEIKGKDMEDLWKRENLLIFIMAMGIVARICAPLITKKGEDPGVIVIDESGSNVIPFLGGHYAYTNKLALEIALLLKAHPAITTASDLIGVPALDIWIKKNNLILKNPELLPFVMSKFNKEGVLKVWLDKELSMHLLQGFISTSNIEEADIIISLKRWQFHDKLILIPRKIWAGIGFHEVLTERDFEEKFNEALRELNIEFLSLKGIATHQKKVNYLPLNNFALNHNLQLLGFTTDQLSKITTLTVSNNVKKLFGINNVSESAAICASQGSLLIPKRVYKDFTIALALEPYKDYAKLYIVGIGPGNLDYLTIKAMRILTQVEAIVGYKSYIKHIVPLIKGKEIYSFSMTEEIKRVKKAVELALKGVETALISGGDPGIYGMAGLLLEYITNNNIKVEVEIIPGISALNIGNALLGAPLANDFAVISLSDRLTPWESIEERLTLIAKSDLPLVIYNPRSKGRTLQFQRALEILRTFRTKKTFVGIINSATRPEQEILITTLEELSEDKVGMNSLIVVGSEAIKKLGKYLVAERGYERKYAEEFKNCSFNE